MGSMNLPVALHLDIQKSRFHQFFGKASLFIPSLNKILNFPELSGIGGFCSMNDYLNIL